MDWVNAYIHTYLHIYIHDAIHTYIHTYIHIYINNIMHTYSHSKIKLDSVQRYPLYLRLPWLGDISDKFAIQISACVSKCYFSSNLRVVFRTQTALTSGRKDVHPPQYSSSLIYYIYIQTYTILWIHTHTDRVKLILIQSRGLLCWPKKQHIRVFDCRTSYK